MNSGCRFVLLLILFFAGWLPAQAAEPGATDVHAAARRLGRGINLGSALEAPVEGEWGVKLRADFFPTIRQAGFATVRLPIRWAAHADAEAPYTLHATFAPRVDWAIEQATKNGLNIILDLHHYDEMDARPSDHLPRLLAIWKQVASRYQDCGANVYFELYNEPHDKFIGDTWNAAIPKLLAVVRKTNPTRPVIVGPGMWNSAGALDKLQLPEVDKHLIVTFHHYEPFHFTHQGTSWVGGSDQWLGTTWNGADDEQAAIRTAFDKVAAWAKQHHRPIFLGEFGAYEKADMASRVRWTSFVARQAEQHGFSWCYWEFCAGFGPYDQKANSWREPLKAALIP